MIRDNAGDISLVIQSYTCVHMQMTYRILRQRTYEYNAIKSIKNCMLICLLFFSIMFVISKENSACFSTGNEVLFINLFYLCDTLCVQIDSAYFSLRCNYSCHISTAPYHFYSIKFVCL